MGLSKLLSTSLLALGFLSSTVVSTPTTALEARQDAASSYWVSSIERQGKAVYADDDNYTVFRNVKDYGATGDGSTDDTAAINKAIQDGPGRCIDNCDSRTRTPALVYFPPGTYMVSTPIIQTYYTQFVGDAVEVPTIKATQDFEGMGVIDANPYDYNTTQDPPPNWYINQNNFFRQVRNFKIDITAMPSNKGACIHWQVAQATSLQNIVFEMSTDTSSANQQKGLFIENGSGGFMANLTFNGGGIGADIGSQQFTSRDMTFNNCQTAIHMIWNWLWLMQGITINGGQVGINMTSDSMETIKVGSLLLLDSKISNTKVGISTLYKPDLPDTNNTLIVDNVDMTDGVPTAIEYAKDGSVLLEGNQVVEGFAQGREYTGSSGKAIQKVQSKISKPDGLLTTDGSVFTRVKPQYETVAASNFVSVKSNGAKGDGQTDDTSAIQKIFDSYQDGQVIYFDHGAYLISDTIKIPKNIKITGEMWPLLMATGDKFTDESNPAVVFEVGQAGDVGTVEMSDLIIETKGALPGAILMQWNVAGSESGSAGLWDVHFRIGGTSGTELQSDICSKNPNVTTTPDAKCMGTFMMLHLTKTASAYIENCWFWVADHELDLEDHNQINIYNGRGVLIEAQNPVWMWGTASEHSVLYNYQITNAQNTFIGVAQTETAYMQGNPDATQGVVVNEGYNDPDFKTSCTGDSDTCARTWGMRVTNSSDVYVLGAGMYSFFNNYAQDIEQSSVHLYGISTKASVNMVTVNGKSIALDSDNRNTFCGAIAQFQSDGSGSSSGSGSGSGSSSGSSSASASASVTISAGSSAGSTQIATTSTASTTAGAGSGTGSGSGSGSGSGTGSGTTSTATSAATASAGSGSGSESGSGSGTGSTGGSAGTSATEGIYGQPTEGTTIATGTSPAETPATTLATTAAPSVTEGIGSGGSGSGSGSGDETVVVTVTQTVTATEGCPTS
ncbi:glucan 1,3-beta-glucosidase GLUC78 precursor [Xylariaceae sp. FL0016]|nr:glucan 1,3-beta-glucosidase GLUC78 precursor [Xylariaceae sp. FL0016]